MKKIILLILCAGVLAACDIADIRTSAQRYTYFLVASEHWNAEDLLDYDPPYSTMTGLFYRDIGPDMDRNRPGSWLNSVGIEKEIFNRCGEVSGYYLFEQGYEYIVKIRIRILVPRQDIQDSGGIAYELVKVVSKEAAETVILPEEVSIFWPTEFWGHW